MNDLSSTTQAVPQSPAVHNELERLQGRIREITGLVGSLENRVSCILTPEAPSPTSGENKKLSKSHCSLASMIESEVDFLDGAIRHLSVILERIEV